MGEQGSNEQPAGVPDASGGRTAGPERMDPSEAAELIGVDARTVARWVDSKKLRGGRPGDPFTGEPVKGSHRWVDAGHAVALAVGAGRRDLIPARWRHLIPHLPDRPGDTRPS